MISVRNLFEAHKEDSGGNVQEGLQKTAKQLGNLINKKEVTVQEVSFQDLFETLVNYDGRINLRLDRPERVAEAMASSSFPVITRQLLHPTVIAAYELAYGDTGQLVTEIPVARDEEKLAGFTDPQGLERVGQLMPYEESVLDEKYVLLKSFKFGRIISLSREMILFDQTGQIVERARRIGEMAGYHKAEFIIKKACSLTTVAITNEAANQSLFWNGTARTMYANDHSSFDVQTNDNLQTTAFSTAGIKASMLLLRKMKNQVGQFINVSLPIDLLIPPDLEEDAWMLANSEHQYDNAENAKNPYKNKFNIIISSFLTDAEDYYIGNFKKQTYWGTVWPIETSEQASNSEKAFENDIVSRFKVSYFGGCNTVDYKYVVKSESS
jgi:hypothetical protein